VMVPEIDNPFRPQRLLFKLFREAPITLRGTGCRAS
jgi:hypothetical protein